MVPWPPGGLFGIRGYTQQPEAALSATNVCHQTGAEVPEDGEGRALLVAALLSDRVIELGERWEKGNTEIWVAYRFAPPAVDGIRNLFALGAPATHALNVLAVK